MRIGLALSGAAMAGYGPRRLGEIVQRAEDAGFEIFMMTEGVLDSMAYLQAFAGMTERIRLATGIANIYFRHPVVMAMSAAAVDQFSAGRLTLGLGVSGPDRNESTLGIPMGDPLRHLREYVLIVRRLLAGETVEHDGPVYRLHNAAIITRPAQERVPIVLAALGPGMARLGGEIADGLVLHMASPARVHAMREAALGARPAEAAGEFTVAAFINLCVSFDVPSARQAARRVIARYAGLEFYQRMLLRSGLGEAGETLVAAARSGEEDLAPHIADSVVDALSAAGAPVHCRSVVQRYVAAGVDLPVLFPTTIDGDWDRALDMIFATFVAKKPAATPAPAPA